MSHCPIHGRQYPCDKCAAKAEFRKAQSQKGDAERDLERLIAGVPSYGRMEIALPACADALPDEFVGSDEAEHAIRQAFELGKTCGEQLSR